MYQTGFVLRNDGFWYAPPIDPSDILDYTLGFAKMLGDDRIASVAWAATDVTIITASNTFTDDTATVWLKLGINRATATVTCTLQTVAGRTIERTFKIEVRQM